MKELNDLGGLPLLAFVALALITGAIVRGGNEETVTAKSALLAFGSGIVWGAVGSAVLYASLLIAGIDVEGSTAYKILFSVFCFFFAYLGHVAKSLVDQAGKDIQKGRGRIIKDALLYVFESFAPMFTSFRDYLKKP